MMNDKIIEEAEYAEIIVTLLNEPYAINDFIKLVFISFCIKHETKVHLKHYQNRKIDISKIFIENIKLKLMSHYNELNIIFEVIDKLITCDFIELKENNIIKINKPLNCDTQNSVLTKFNEMRINPVLEINKLDTNEFMEGVLRYV